MRRTQLLTSLSKVDEHTETFTRFQCCCRILSKYGATHTLSRTSPIGIPLYVTVRIQSRMLVGYWLACVAIYREMAGLTIRAQGFNLTCDTPIERMSNGSRTLELLSDCRRLVPQGIRDPQWLLPSVAVLRGGRPLRCPISGINACAPQPLHNRLPSPAGLSLLTNRNHLAIS